MLIYFYYNKNDLKLKKIYIMNEDNLLSPYIIFHERNKEYTAYIPYKITDNNERLK